MQAQVALVISNKADAFALERAKKANIPTLVLPSVKGEDRAIYESKLIDALTQNKIGLVVLAGFMRILTPHFVNAFKNKIINIHPSLLPSFPGLHVHKQALDHGVKVSGCTVHFVDDGCDTGPIILQATVPVLDNDTEESLAARILTEEHKILPKAIDLYAKNKVKVVNRKVIFV